MKIKINEYDHTFWLTLEPETIEEAAQLMRLANTAKRKPINFTTHFSREVFCEFGINKKDSSHCSNIVTNQIKK